MVFTCHSRWVKKVEDIMMKMVPRPLPSLISSVISWLYYGLFTCHYYFGSNLKELLITFYVKLMTHTRVWEWKSAILFLTKSTWFSSGRSKLQLTMINFSLHFTISYIFFCRTLNFIWLFLQYLLQQEPFT